MSKPPSTLRLVNDLDACLWRMVRAERACAQAVAREGVVPERQAALQDRANADYSRALTALRQRAREEIDNGWPATPQKPPRRRAARARSEGTEP